MWIKNHRWSSHADMALQYGNCVQKRLAAQGINISALHLDVWKSLNGRFHQRVFDPTINILKAPWSPWTKVGVQYLSYYISKIVMMVVVMVFFHFHLLQCQHRSPYWHQDYGPAQFSTRCLINSICTGMNN